MVGRLNFTRTTVYPTPNEASLGLAERLAGLATEATQRPGRFALAVSGGRTPEELYTLLGESYGTQFPWADTDLYFADERAVPPEDPRSNFGLIQRTLLDRLRGSGLRVHRIEAERAPPDTVAALYEADLRASLGGPPSGPPTQPTFDWIVLGVGSDGHTASLFPGSSCLEEVAHWTVVEPSPHLDPHVPRISLTLPVISASRHALFLVCGKEKRGIVEEIINDPARGTPQARLPSARVTATETVEWFLDAAAAPPADPSASG